MADDVANEGIDDKKKKKKGKVDKKEEESKDKKKKGPSQAMVAAMQERLHKLKEDEERHRVRVLDIFNH